MAIHDDDDELHRKERHNTDQLGFSGNDDDDNNDHIP
jgi:hypothetical protein